MPSSAGSPSAPGSWRRDPGIAAWSAFLRAHASVVRTLEREVEAATGLSLGWYDVLLELSAVADEGLRMGELGERAVLSRTRISRIVDELVAAGYVCRTADPRDRRSAHAVITADGRSVLRRAAPWYLQAVRQHFGDVLTPVQLQVTREAMESLIDRHGPGRPT